ncbi:hypothetical protein NXX67_07350 [Bacteroides fragilis]|nr:hypothetical protein NXX67_07350 [Bacteroides fragilis]
MYPVRAPAAGVLFPFLEDIDERDGMYREAFRHMPDGAYVHKQDVFLKKSTTRAKAPALSWTVPTRATLKDACTSTTPVSCTLYLQG